MGFFNRIFRRQPNIVAIGGGTGLSMLLRGLKIHTDKILAVCTVADDGGSSGRLRKEFDILPPGDIRNCLVALSDTDELLEKLFQYRFDESELKGHSFGNIFLAALTRVTGDFYTAVQEANRVLNVRGMVLPATLTKIALVAHHADGTKSTGESLIGRGTGKEIERISLRPEPELASDEILEWIAEADLIILGPGSLYTSIIPNLLIPGILPALMESTAIKAYVCNVMTQPGETGEFTVSDHIAALQRHSTPSLVDFVVVNDGPISSKARLKYEQGGSIPVKIDEEAINSLPGDFEVIAADIVHADSAVRHDPKKLAETLLETYREISRDRARDSKSA